MPSSFSKVLFRGANLFIPTAILIFAIGFFPYKPVLPGLAIYKDIGHGPPPPAPFDRVVFMVVDALRSDFVYAEPSGFQFTQGLIRSGNAIPFTAHATSPTITMPRVKAITTGSIPSFLDVILNFAESDTTSTLANQDTWLAQVKAQPEGNLIFYGDDTWLKLFPDFFSREDGTSSFFVSDFTEVDNNVTRHVPEELRKTDWNAMIMHYLGLDHIGHKSGPRSPNMLPKQSEMDGIVKTIYEAILQEPHLSNCLFVLCGDHGMNDAGNHGGSSSGEISPALVFMSPKIQGMSDMAYRSPLEAKSDFQFYRTVEQSDIAPTLAGLLGFPVPLNNLGVFIPEFLDFWANENDRLRLLTRNAFQILDVVKATFPTQVFEEDLGSQNCNGPRSAVEALGCDWINVNKQLQLFRSEGSQASYTEALKSLLKFSRSAQELMSSTSSNYDMPKLYLGIFLAASAVLLAFLASLPALRSSRFASHAFVMTILVYSIMMFASSYVEEEQNFWYWATCGWLACLYLRESQLWPKVSIPGLFSVFVAILARISRRWNQTGQKHAGAPDIANTFFRAHHNVMWVLVIAAYLDIGLRLVRHRVPQMGIQVSSIMAITLCLVSFGFKLAFTVQDAPELVGNMSPTFLNQAEGISLVSQARAVFIDIGLSLVYNIVQCRGNEKKTTENKGLAFVLHDLLGAFLITQSRVSNIPLFLLFEVQLNLLSTFALSPTEITMTTLLFQHASFFALGNSNAISSVDLSSAYNGVSGYSVWMVGILIFVGNWAGPIWWTSAANILLLKASSGNPKGDTREGGSREIVIEKGEGLYGHMSLMTLFTAGSLLSVMVACTVLRVHLFIWTVFSPKYLYEMAWGVGMHLGVNIGLGSVLAWAI